MSTIPATPLGQLGRIPPELRVMVYDHLIGDGSDDGPTAVRHGWLYNSLIRSKTPGLIVIRSTNLAATSPALRAEIQQEANKNRIIEAIELHELPISISFNTTAKFSVKALDMTRFTNAKHLVFKLHIHDIAKIHDLKRGASAWPASIFIRSIVKAFPNPQSVAFNLEDYRLAHPGVSINRLTTFCAMLVEHWSDRFGLQPYCYDLDGIVLRDDSGEFGWIPKSINHGHEGWRPTASELGDLLRPMLLKKEVKSWVDHEEEVEI